MYAAQVNEADGSEWPLEEMESLTNQLEIGILVTLFFKKKQPDKRTLRLKKETRQIVWYKEMSRRNVYEGTINLRDVKEIRYGKNSIDFEKWTEQVAKLEENQCFAFFYGQRFNLKTLSISISKDCDKWVELLRYLTRDTIESSYPLQMERWLWREYFNMTTDRTTVTLKDLRAFFPYVNLQISKVRLKEAFQEVVSRSTDDLSFEEFASLYQSLIYDENLFRNFFLKYSSDGTRISQKDFQAFAVYQGDEAFEQDDAAINFMKYFVRDSRRVATDEPVYFTPKEFMSYLFSHHNEVWDPQHSTINYEAMNHPLSHYWIASSHNTYLTGNQYSSSSSVETYARCLKLGCRCIELDCWDGPDGMPVITHGHTITSTIRCLDVVKTIKEHAFTTSPYPVILSIEDHCSLPQQRQLAKMFEEVFGSMLLTSPINENDSGNKMPSPQSLQWKIIIKHKKLPEGFAPSISVDESLPIVIERPDEMGDLGLSNVDKNGVLYLENQLDGEWTPYFYFLSDTKLLFVSKFQPNNEGETEEGDDEEDSNSPYYSQPLRDGVAEYELHFSEEWFHDWRGQPSRLTHRVRAEKLLHQHGPQLGDGAFLVRNSDNFVGDFTLSFWRQGRIEHFRIKRPPLKVDGRVVKYYQVETESFDSLYNLINHYKTKPLHCRGNLIILDKPVPQPCPHESEKWYHSKLSGSEAAKVLCWVARDGAYLVRPSEQESGTFSISFRAEGQVKHCRIKQDGRLFVIGNAEFPSLVDLVHHYENNNFYRKIKLLHPVTEQMVRHVAGLSPEEIEANNREYVPSSYMDSNVISTGVTVRALRDCFTQQQGEELCFCKDAIITNVKKDDEWWRGDYKEQRQLLFRADFVEEIEMTPELQEQIESSSRATTQGGPKDSYDLTGATVEIELLNPMQGRSDSPTGSIMTEISISSTGKNAPEWLLRIKLPSQTETLDFGVQSGEEAVSWRTAIENAVQRVSELKNMHRKIENSCRIAKELSDLVVYCRATSFDKERLQRTTDGRNPYEMSSFAEEKAERMVFDYKFFLWYHEVMFSRVYPKGTRLDSSNYSPVSFWNVGSQMVALNYQTPDKPMQINHGKFLQNGKCGYVLKPPYMLKNSEYHPEYCSSLAEKNPITIILKVIAGRHLPKSGRGIASPCVEVEIIGTRQDVTSNKYITKTITDNGFNPVWDETFEFKITCPSLALLRFAVYDTDKFSDTYAMAQATYPVLCLRQGIRSIPLKNSYSELLEMSSLLISLDIHNRLVDASPIMV